MAKLRIYKTIAAYYDYTNAFYKKYPELINASFLQQLDAFSKDSFHWLTAWRVYNTDSNVEIFETIYNAFPLQNAWANGRYTKDEKWEKPIVLEQIRAFQPDVCFLYSPEFFDKSFIDEVKSINSNMFICGYDGMHRQKIDLFAGYDLVLTCSPYISKYYQDNHKLTYWFYSGFDANMLKLIETNRHLYKVGFSGSVLPWLHKDRVELVSAVQRKVPFTMSSEFTYLPGGLLRRRALRQIKDISPSHYIDFLRLYNHNIGPVYGQDMFQFLSDCDVVLNMHGDSIKFAANFRLFEATGVGSCLLTDWKENIADIFEPGKEVLTYHSVEEAADIAKYCVEHPDYCEEISRKGQKRTLNEYSFGKIIPQIIRYIKNIVGL